MLTHKKYMEGDSTPLKKELGGVQPSEDGATATFILSNADVDRYGDSIDCKGWELANYKANPVVLFGHDASDVKNVVGRMVDIQNDGSNLIGTVEFTKDGDNPNADIVRKLVQSGFLKTVSVGFRPLEAKAANDPKRKGGWDFKKQELLEVSIVPVPALPSALAKSAIAEVGSDEVRKELEYGLGLLQDGIATKRKAQLKTKGLCEVAWLASLLYELGWLEECVEAEATMEGDGSTIPTDLGQAMQMLGKILIEMTTEEVNELLAEEIAEEEGETHPVDPDLLEMEDEEKSALTAVRLIRKAAQADVRTISSVLRKRASGIPVSFKIGKAPEAPMQRAGRILSSANEAVLAEVKSTLTEACGKVEKVLAQVAESTDQTSEAKAAPAADEDEAVRLRTAEALRRRFR